MMIEKVFLPALLETIYMVSMSTLFAVLAGFILAFILVVTASDGLRPNKAVFGAFDLLVNVLRSFPFIILMIAIFPVTKALAGTTIGTTASIVPLTIAAAPFAARVIESALKEVDPGVIEAAKSFGATTWQILFKIMLVEALPAIAMGIVLTVITLVGYSAMAGAIGGGGLGDVAIKYGYYRFQTDIMMYTVIILIIFVQLVQSFGNVIYKKLIG
jgi:D-methionine transport system permease protein